MPFDSPIYQTLVSYFLGGLIALLIMTNPISKIPLFLSLTREMDDRLRNGQARQACLYAVAILIVSLFGGVLILRGFGISYGALRIAGGLTVALLGYRMLFQDPQRGLVGHQAQHSISFFPLAMPGISGPGSIAVVIGISTEIAEMKSRVQEAAAYAATVASILITCAVVWATLRFSAPVSRKIGQEGMDAMGRMMGFVMVCIGVQLVGSGARTFMLET
ncbi:MAG TPA: MarC family NAAT transporter [Albitalea sp.]|nr:MarC family NAAT transporter [Albitalea sp.]